MPSTSIYYINNIFNDPNIGYVGKTTNFRSRMYDHKSTYGESIIITIIDEVSSDWKFWENYWIEQFKSWGVYLLNKNKGGGGPEFRSTNFCENLSKKLKKTIQQFDKNHNLVKEWSSIKEAKLYVGGDIDGCLKGRIKSAKGFYWRYYSQDTPKFNSSPRIGKRVFQYSKDQTLLNIYNSTQEAEKEFNSGGKDNIGACCRGKQKTAYGYIWKY